MKKRTILISIFALLLVTAGSTYAALNNFSSEREGLYFLSEELKVLISMISDIEEAPSLPGRSKVDYELLIKDLKAIQVNVELASQRKLDPRVKVLKGEVKTK